MSKRGNKGSNMSASSVMKLLSEPDPEDAHREINLEARPNSRPESEWRRYAECGYCGKKKQPISYTECDENWEFPEHPDYIDRDVCVACVDEAYSRNQCCLLVYAKLREQLRDKDQTDYEIENEVHTIWRSFNVEFDHKILVRTARRLRVKHPWLKGKRSK